MTVEENFERLWSQLLELGITDVRVRSALEDILLQEGLAKFVLANQWSKDQDSMVYHITFNRAGDNFYIQQLGVALKQHQFIDHFVFKGIDTSQLNERMLAIDWDTIPYVNYEQPPEGWTVPVDAAEATVYHIYRDIKTLMQSGVSAVIGTAFKLQYNHWFGTHFGEFWNLPIAKTLCTFPIIEVDLTKNWFTLQQMHMLAQGHPLHQEQVTPEGIRKVWYQYSDKLWDEQGKALLEELPDFDVSRLLAALPFPLFHSNVIQAENRLRQGKPLLAFPENGTCLVGLNAKSQKLVLHFAGKPSCTLAKWFEQQQLTRPSGQRKGPHPNKKPPSNGRRKGPEI